MKPVTEYFILISNSPDQLVQLVNAAIKQNKQPFGYPFVIPGASGGIPRFAQAMAFYDTEGTDL